MKHTLIILCAILLMPASLCGQALKWLIPVNVENRRSWASVQLTKIGAFGHVRKPRPGIPEHLHTGMDIKRPHNNYVNEPVFPAARGKVISMRDDGPFAQIIIEHPSDSGGPVWTVYEHVAGIRVTNGDRVDPHEPMARFMTRAELNRFGWQFDHVHFEVMKIKPRPLKPTKKTPFRLFNTYWLDCWTEKDLYHYYHHPKVFMTSQWNRQN